MLHEMEIATGIDLARLLDGVRQAERMLNMTFPGQVIKAGRSCDLHSLPDGNQPTAD
jgi:hydroxymethylglutaryl-CoA lyase